MKKIYTIGRDGGCDIVIPDNTDVISRLHATIRVESNDKIYLTDQSRNGTYINGMKMSSNVEIPVSRKDVVSLAHIYDLDWSLVPKQKSRTKILIVAVLLVALLAGTAYFFFGMNKGTSNEPVEQAPTPPPMTMEPDTVLVRDTVIVKSDENEPDEEQNTKTQPDETQQKEEQVKEDTEKPTEEIYNPIY